MKASAVVHPSPFILHPFILHHPSSFTPHPLPLLPLPSSAGRSSRLEPTTNQPRTPAGRVAAGNKEKRARTEEEETGSPLLWGREDEWRESETFVSAIEAGGPRRGFPSGFGELQDRQCEVWLAGENWSRRRAAGPVYQEEKRRQRGWTARLSPIPAVLL